MEIRNPFDPKYQASYITSSTMKKEYAERLGITVNTSEELIKALGQSESDAGQIFGDGVSVRQKLSEVPYPIRIAHEKGKSVIKIGMENDNIYFVVSDVVWRLSSNFCNSFLNKPRGIKTREIELVQIYSDSIGREISSDSGIALIHPKNNKITLFYTSLVLGKIKEDINFNLLLELIKSNPGFSSGLSLELMFEHILEAKKMLKFFVKIFRVSDTDSISLEETKLPPVNIEKKRENYLLYKAIAIGIIPPQIIFSS